MAVKVHESKLDTNSTTATLQTLKSVWSNISGSFEGDEAMTRSVSRSMYLVASATGSTQVIEAFGSAIDSVMKNGGSHIFRKETEIRVLEDSRVVLERALNWMQVPGNAHSLSKYEKAKLKDKRKQIEDNKEKTMLLQQEVNEIKANIQLTAENIAKWIVTATNLGQDPMQVLTEFQHAADTLSLQPKLLNNLISGVNGIHHLHDLVTSIEKEDVVITNQDGSKRNSSILGLIAELESRIGTIDERQRFREAMVGLAFHLGKDPKAMLAISTHLWGYSKNPDAQYRMINATVVIAGVAAHTNSSEAAVSVAWLAEHMKGERSAAINPIMKAIAAISNNRRDGRCVTTATWAINTHLYSLSVATNVANTLKDVSEQGFSSELTLEYAKRFRQVHTEDEVNAIIAQYKSKKEEPKKDTGDQKETPKRGRGRPKKARADGITNNTGAELRE